MSNGYTMDEMKLAIIKAMNSAPISSLRLLKDELWEATMLDPYYYIQRHTINKIRRSQNPDFLEYAANLLIDAGIYYKNERFYFPDDGELDE